MAKLNNLWTSYLQEFKSNKRLQYGSMVILLITLVNGSLHWSDRITTQTQELKALTGEIVTLKQQAMDETLFQEALTKATQAHQIVEARLWTVPTDAIGQARLKDWLLDTMARAGITNPNLNLANPKPIEEAPPPLPQSASSTVNRGGLKRFGATISFRFTPETLERCLGELEGGDPFIAVDTLVINKREARVEIGLGVLISVAPLGGEAAR